MTKLAHVRRLHAPGTSKGDLLDAIATDSILDEWDDTQRERVLRIAAEEIVRRRPKLQPKLAGYLRRLGWALHDASMIPIEVFDIAELGDLPPESHSDMIKAAARPRDGDLSGALTAARGAVDAVTSKIYLRESLGDLGKASFQEEVRKSLRVCRALPHLAQELATFGWKPEKIKPVGHTLVGSLNQAAYVMQTLRSGNADVHGTRPVLSALVYDSPKWAALILRVLTQA